MCDCMQQAGVPLNQGPTVDGFYGISGNTVGIAKIVSPVTNQNDVSASVTISTDAVDRQRESILAPGINIATYETNPVVLWEHGLDPHIPFPMGSSRSPSGQLSLQQRGNAWDATCYFSQSYDKAMQCFAMVDEGIIRAASIQAIPDPAAITRDYDPNGRAFTVIRKCDMVEWSWGRIGVNPEAVRKSLAAGKIGQEKLLPCFREMLEPFAAKRKIWRAQPVRVYRSPRPVLGIERYSLAPKTGKLR